MVQNLRLSLKKKVCRFEKYFFLIHTYLKKENIKLIFYSFSFGLIHICNVFDIFVWVWNCFRLIQLASNISFFIYKNYEINSFFYRYGCQFILVQWTNKKVATFFVQQSLYKLQRSWICDNLAVSFIDFDGIIKNKWSVFIKSD